jgi:hypothetical protein
MGMPLCCISRKNEVSNYSNENNIQILGVPNKIDKFTEKIIKIQSWIRVYLSQNKLGSLFESTKAIIIKELDQKKLINKSNITECESHLIYEKNKLYNSFNEHMNSPELKNLISKLSKYSFVIPYYIVTSPNEVYKGSWNINKKYNGHGVKYEFNSEKTTNKRIEGIFLNGFLFGYGIIIFSNGEILKGNFVNNSLNGRGEHIRKDQSKYTGEFRNGKYNGFGVENYSDGSVFEGFFTEGEKKYGKYEWKNGSKYNGEFSDNVFNGKGIYKWPNNKTYDGNWKKGKMNGRGKFTYEDGTFYEGEFLNGIKSGQGKYVWAKDRYFEGKWKNNRQNGYGVYYDKNKIIRGNWIDGKIVNKNISLIKKANTFLRESKKKNETPIKKGISTQENFYRRHNLTEKKQNSAQINFNPTVNGKYTKRDYRNYLNLNTNKNNQNSIYSIESTNTVKSNNNQDAKTLNGE